MKDMERENFENEWKNAFEQAEISPSDNLWTSIELELERAEGKKMKRKLLHYKFMAAASITFALCFAGVGFYYFSNERRNYSSDQLALQSTVKNELNTSALQSISERSNEGQLLQKKNEPLNQSSQVFDADKRADETDRAEENHLPFELKPNDDGKISLPVRRNSVGLKAAHQIQKRKPHDGEEFIAETRDEILKDKTNTESNIFQNESQTEKYTKANILLSRGDNVKSTKELRASGKPAAIVDLDKHFKDNLENKEISEQGTNISNEPPVMITSKLQYGTSSKDAAVALMRDNSSGSDHQTQTLTDNRERLVTKVPVGKLSTDPKNLDGNFTFRELPPLIETPKVELSIQKKEEDPFKVMMARLEKREAELAKEDVKELRKNTIVEKLWTSVGFAAGNVNSSNSSVSSSSGNNTMARAGNTSNTAINQSRASGTSYSAGLNVGTKVAKRWVVQGGLNYISQTSAYQSDAVVASPNLDNFRAASLTDVNNTKSNTKASKLVGTSNYRVNNNLQYVSVPLQAGYIIVNHTFAFQVNGGISTDLFIQNTLTPENSNLEKVTQRGDESSYRPVNFSGLFGTEISYRFGKHYRLALNPGLRYPINSIYKAGTGVVANPVTMDVAMRFRYIFN